MPPVGVEILHVGTERSLTRTDVGDLQPTESHLPPSANFRQSSQLDFFPPSLNLLVYLFDMIIYDSPGPSAQPLFRCRCTTMHITDRGLKADQ
jgi:hypothetical protein